MSIGVDEMNSIGDSLSGNIGDMQEFNEGVYIIIIINTAWIVIGHSHL